ncbi:MAG: COX15/CtaA family protein, partial [Rhodospirillaceae bacterium]|nr:COX15/CtaA family protein [Rhodospirillaceae bacterium]
VWLLLVCAMILAMVVIGGVTRLTESGLSITEWRPVSGVLPPLSAADWQDAFARYQQIPQYRQLNPHMTLAEFKGIYWWEYVHRLWGRLIGLAFALPLFYFAARGRIPRALVPRLLLLLALGAAQGGLGWYMVESGLAERVSVSQYRLAAHLALALAIYAGMLWLAFGLLRPRPAALAPQARARLRPHLWLIGGWTAVTILFGAFVAGLDGGFIYNTFPLMGGRLVPSDAFTAAPLWRDPFENPATAQFIHRWLAVGLVAAVLALWLRARRAAADRSVRRALDLLAGMALVQAGLGLATLLLVVPVPLAAAHQAGAVLLLSFVVWALHCTRAGTPAPPRGILQAPGRALVPPIPEV